MLRTTSEFNIELGHATPVEFDIKLDAAGGYHGGVKSEQVLDLSPAESAALTAVAQGVALMRRAAERNLAARSDMNRPRFEVLRQLRDAPDGVRMFELADRLVLSRSTLTHHLTELEKAGLAVREGGTATQRAVRARITDAGVALVDELRSAHAELVRTHFIECFTPEELALVAAGFSRVVESFGDEASTLARDGKRP